MRIFIGDFISRKIVSGIEYRVSSIEYRVSGIGYQESESRSPLIQE